jgi:hypothetical protein
MSSGGVGGEKEESPVPRGGEKGDKEEDKGKDRWSRWEEGWM